MNDRISVSLADAHNSLREQLDLAQRHFERLEQVLAARETKDISSLNHSVRRLRSSQEQWNKILVDATQGFSERAALFALQGSSLHLEAVRNVGDAGSLPDVPLDSAPAFRSAVESRDTVVAERTSGEMSAVIAARLGEAANQRFYLFPVATDARVVAVLYADGRPGSIQPDALELLATVAGAVLERSAPRPSDDLVNIAQAVNSNERDLHLKAQRFARVQVAEIRLYQSEHVKNGRAGRDLYTSLKTEIDSARDVFRRDFLTGSESMVDYLHLELVNTLAHGESDSLGPDYPGPMVKI